MTQNIKEKDSPLGQLFGGGMQSTMGVLMYYLDRTNESLDAVPWLAALDLYTPDVVHVAVTVLMWTRASHQNSRITYIPLK